jgi:hypothetical protein
MKKIKIRDLLKKRGRVRKVRRRRVKRKDLTVMMM